MEFLLPIGKIILSSYFLFLFACRVKRCHGIWPAIMDLRERIFD